jgi:hypothetical protein
MQSSADLGVSEPVIPATRETSRGDRRTAADGRTCAGCAVTVSWMPGVEHEALPPNWIADERGAFCLLCRRTMAADAALALAPEGTTREGRAKLRTAAVIEFEIKRAPDRANGEIAKGCRSSVAAVLQARKRLAA